MQEQNRENLDAENQDDVIITLVNEEGEKIDFIEFARLEFEGETYAILQPVKLFENMKENEAFVFRVSKDEHDVEKYDIQVEDEIVNGVFDEYYRLLDEEEAEKAK